MRQLMHLNGRPWTGPGFCFGALDSRGAFVGSIRCRCPLFAALLMGCSCFTSGASAQEKYTGRQVFDAWKARQAKVNAIRVEFAETMLFPKGKLTLGKKYVTHPGAKETPAPRQDARVESRIRLFLARDGKIRYEVDGQAWDDNSSNFVRQNYVSTINGKTNKTFYDRGQIGAELHPCGFVNTQTVSIDAGNYHLLPFVLLFRPLDQSMGGFSDEGWSVATQEAFVGDSRCLVLERVRDGLQQQIWIEPERDFVPLRLIQKAEGEERVRFTCSYQDEKDDGWIPSSWEIVVFDRGHLINESAQGRMVRYEINPRLDIHDFSFEFPPGTEVTDHVQKKVYIPLDGGGRRYLNEGESYVTIMTTSIGFGAASWLFWIGISAGIVIVVAYFRLRQRQKSAP